MVAPRDLATGTLDLSRHSTRFQPHRPIRNAHAISH